MTARKRTPEPESNYTASDITLLEGLEAVRKRPAMYIGGVHKAGLHHLLWEIVDNSIDEAMNGYASELDVRLHSDGKTVSVRDNGRGIPVEMHPVYQKPTLELILTKLHSGGKFNNNNYKHSGGLHGVGISVVNALSEYMKIEVCRGGGRFEQEFSKGDPVAPIEQKAKNIRQTGTTVTFRADPEIFRDSVTLEASQIRERLEVAAYLHSGLAVKFRNEVDGIEEVFHHEGGLQDYLDHLLKNRNNRVVHEGTFVHSSDGEMRMEVALCWTEDTDEFFKSFVNGIVTRSGGTHENGLKLAIAKAVRNYINTHKLQPKGMTISTEDIREGVVALFSVYVQEPQFQGQTKERLNNPEVQPLVDQVMRAALEQWLNENSTAARAIVARIIMAARARAASRAASQVVRQSPTRRLSLPGKLADCAQEDPAQSELFIVEGDSAGGSAKMGRDRKNQAILPLRGKVLNTETANLKKILNNKEISDLVQALGCGIDKQFDLEKLRYHKIILLMDADADGHHIATLLLTFFYRHIPELIHQGYIYLAQPPLYRISVRKEVYWALDDDEKDRLLAEAPANAQVDIQRFKGLGEMLPQVLRETTLDPSKRTLLRVCVDDPLHTDQVMSDLLGKDANARFRFIMERAHEVDEVDLSA